jgi:hypothetical protein
MFTESDCAVIVLQRKGYAMEVNLISSAYIHVQAGEGEVGR